MFRQRLIITFYVTTILLLSLNPAIAQDSSPIRIIFMHHSTGANLIQQGSVREALARLGYEFWDHGYNDEGLVDAAGESTGVNWEVPDDNTDPDGWYRIFSQSVTTPPANTFSHMQSYDVIIFKSCFPASDIQSDDQLEEYRRYYLSIRDVIDQHPDKLFIPFTTPPLVPSATSLENAARARQWAQYLTSQDYLEGHSNLFVFDIFDQLADTQGYLRAAYRSDQSDSHPNELANRKLGRTFARFVDQAIQDFYQG